MSLEELNIPVSITIHFEISVGDERFTVTSDPGEGVLNPWEHATPESFMADCQHTTRRWLTEMRNSTAGTALADHLAAPLAALVQNFASEQEDGPTLDSVSTNR